MNIAIFTDVYPPYVNGVATSAFNLAKTLRSHGHHVIVVASRFDKGKLERRGDDIFVPGFALKKLYGYRIGSIFNHRLLKMIKKEHIEVIHQETELTVGLSAIYIARKLHIPLVYTYHTAYQDYTYYVTKGKPLFEKITKEALYKTIKVVAKRVPAFICPSEKTAYFIYSIAGKDRKLDVIPTGIDLSLFNKEIDITAINEFKRQHDIKPDEKIIIAVGRLAKEKSFDYLLEAYKKYLDNNPNYPTKLLIVGEGPDRKELEAFTQKLGIEDKVVFLGFVPKDQMGFYYHLSSLYISSSLSETQGLTYIEAMASNVPVILRKDDVLANNISNGINGFIFETQEECAYLIYRVLGLGDIERSKLTSKAYQFVDKEYSLENFYQKSIKVYQRVIYEKQTNHQNQKVKK